MAVFVAHVQATPASSLSPALQPVLVQLAQRGYRRVAPVVAPVPPPATASALNQLRDKGQAFMHDLASDVSPNQMLREYEASIDKALELASAVTSQDRSLLWSMCLLRVQLYAMLPSGNAASVDEAVRACRLRFPDQHYFDKIWIAEVAAAFRAHEKRAENSTTLEVRSAPAGCDVFVYGASVGKTPIRLSVVKGDQEVQVRCGEESSLLHRVKVGRPETLIVRLAGDAAYEPDFSEAIDLRYKESSGMSEARDHAQAFALEAGAESFVLIEAGDGFKLSLRDAAGVRTEGISRDASSRDIERAVARLFDSPGRAPAAEASTSAQGFKRTPDDYGVGFAFVATGLGLVAGSIPGIVRYADLSKGAVWGPIVAGAACVVTGITIISVGPFGRRRAVQANVALNGLSVRGTF